MRRITVNGRKKKGDKIFGFECQCGECFFPTYDDLAWINVECFNNEHLLYPPSEGFEGGKKWIMKIFEGIKNKGYDIQNDFSYKQKSGQDEFFWN
jgi:hypothetical protein